MTPRDFFEAFGALIAAIAALTFAYQRYVAIRAKDRTAEQGESAIQAQFVSLRDAINANRKEAADARSEAAEARIETAELRHEFARMDRVIHNQQRTITRMEMLLRQFTKLVQESGTTVPKHMREELNDLVVDSESLLNKTLNAEVSK